MAEFFRIELLAVLGQGGSYHNGEALPAGRRQRGVAGQRSAHVPENGRIQRMAQLAAPRASAAVDDRVAQRARHHAAVRLCSENGLDFLDSRISRVQRGGRCNETFASYGLDAGPEGPIRIVRWLHLGFDWVGPSFKEGSPLWKTNAPSKNWSTPVSGSMRKPTDRLELNDCTTSGRLNLRGEKHVAPR